MAIQTMLTDSGDNKAALNEHSFRRMISLERKRSERSRKPFLLMLLDTGTDFAGVSNNVPHAIVSALSSVSRETDVMGWYHNDRVLGVMFTEIAVSNREMIADVVLTRINDALRSSLPPELFSRVNLSYHFFPENWDFDTPTGPKI